MDQNPSTPDSHMWMKDWAISARFDINDSWTMKFDGHIMNGTSGCYTIDNKRADGTVDLEEDWLLFAAKVQYSF